MTGIFAICELNLIFVFELLYLFYNLIQCRLTLCLIIKFKAY